MILHCYKKREDNANNNNFYHVFRHNDARFKKILVEGIKFRHLLSFRRIKKIIEMIILKTLNIDLPIYDLSVNKEFDKEKILQLRE